MSTWTNEMRAEAPKAPVPSGDPQVPDEGQTPEEDPRTTPENPEPDRDRIDKGEEDLDRVGK